MRILPVVFSWREVDIVDADGVATRGLAMVPQARYVNVAKRQFVDGEEYPLVVLEARSRASHSHFFAALSDGFENLPETIAARFPSPEHLRKWLLVETGWFEERDFDCPDEGFAKRLAKFIRVEDEYARISIHRTGSSVFPFKVIVRRAKSQSAAAMGKTDFEASKKDVLDLLEHMTAVPKGALMKNAGKVG